MYEYNIFVLYYKNEIRSEIGNLETGILVKGKSMYWSVMFYNL